MMQLASLSNSPQKRLYQITCFDAGYTELNNPPFAMSRAGGLLHPLIHMPALRSDQPRGLPKNPDS